MKQYIKVKINGGKVTHLKVETYYSLGGMNYFNYKTERRGYYLSVVPVERMDKGGYIMEGYVMCLGIKDCIKEVQRKSKKAETEAEKLATERMKDLIDYVLNQNGLELEETIA